MTGRQLFKLFEPVLLSVSFILKLLPEQVSLFLYWLVSSIPGKLGRGLRYPIAKRLAANCGKNLAIAEHVVILEWSGLTIGDNVQIHPFCYLDGTGEIEIGSNVSIAHATSLLSFEHTWNDASMPIKYNPLITEKVIVENDVWIGCGVRVLSGAQIRSRTVIAAGSVVTSGNHPSGLYGGIPAKRIKSLD